MARYWYRCPFTNDEEGNTIPLVAKFGVPYAVAEADGDTALVLVSTSDREALEADDRIIPTNEHRENVFVADADLPALPPPEPKLTQAQREQWIDAYKANPMGLGIGAIWTEEADYDLLTMTFLDGDVEVGRQRMMFYSPHVVHSVFTTFLPEYQNTGQYKFIETALYAVLLDWGMEKLTMDVIPGHPATDMFIRHGWRQDPDNPALLYGDITGNYFGVYG